MTFEQTIAAANRVPSFNFHIFTEFADGRRGYYASRELKGEAQRLARKLDGLPIIYDREGNEVAE